MGRVQDQPSGHPGRRAARRRRRRPRYGRFIAQTAIGSLVPGTGLIAAGRRRLGAAVLALFVAAGLGVLAVIAVVPTRRLASYGGDRQMMFVIGVALVAAAAIWLIVALVSHRLLEPARLPAGKRLGGALVVVVVTSLVVAPLSLGARNAFVQRDLIQAISGGESLTTPDIDTSDPWADMPRLNLLLMGSDAGPGRDGERLNTLIVVSIDTHTGDATMIGIPRNLQRMPFAAASPLSGLYPQGFDGAGDEREWMAMSIYSNAPILHPEVFEGTDNPGADATKWAVEGALDIDVDYFIFVNMEGFQVLVDALGGVTLNVPRDIPIGNKNREDGPGCTTPRGWIRAGDNQQLNGGQALWFARSRCMSTDYDRMARQQCLLGAITNQANPRTLFTQYQSIASATREIIKTDIPEDLFPPLIELAFVVRDGSLESLTLDRDFFQTTTGTNPSNPDYAQLQAHINTILTAGPDGDPLDDESEPPAADADGATDEREPPANEPEPPADDEQPSTDETDDDGATDEDTGDGDTIEVSPDQPVETDAVC
ncbi:LCP family protein [Phytoactinopolyspora limicola]|uniref:LCP family protein n=1 Tax=Phytoactinopolyspora limicola TaxID=2715536 RepID=UPI00140B650C|nr:LCP family protein [Phytoactinopolyspora limicola]